jgi:hypothetical protein
VYYDVPTPHPAGDELKTGLNIAIVKIQSLEMGFQYRERMRYGLRSHGVLRGVRQRRTGTSSERREIA